MAFFNRNKQPIGYTAAHTAIEDAFTTGKMGNKETGEIIARFSSLEALSADDAQAMESAEAKLETVLNSDAVLGYIRTAAGLSDHKELQTPANNAVLSAAMEAMTHAAFAVNAPDEYMEAYSSPSQASNGVTVIGEEIGYDLEGFDDFKFDKFKAATILSAGLNMATSPFSQTFFKPVNVPAGQSGLDLSVQLPQIHGRTIRKNDGTPFNFKKHSIVRAALDHNILEANQTRIHPISKADNNPYLVDAAHGLEFDEPVSGEILKVRPIAYGKLTNLIGVSSSARIMAMGAQTETDTLDPYVSIGSQYLKITNNADATKEVYLALDMSSLPGSVLQHTAEGNVRDKATVFTGSQWISSGGVDIKAVSMTTLGFETPLGLAAATGEAAKWRVPVTIRLSATLAQEKGDMIVDLNEIKFGRARLGANYATEATDVQQAALEAAFTIEGLGYYPGAQRSNSNMKDLATIVDSGSTYNWRIGLPMEAPISSVKAPGVMGGGVSMDTLSAVKRLRNLGSAASELQRFERKLIATAGIPEANVAIGDILVDATYRAYPLDLSNSVKTMSSASGLVDMQTYLVNAVTMLANELILESNYRNALHVYTGNANNFEVNIVTDPMLANLLMSAGDGRTLGNGRRFNVTELDDLRFRNQIYVTLGRTDVAGADVLNPGVHLSSPALIYKATTTRGQAVAGETQMMPREKFVMTLPILGRLNVSPVHRYFD